MSDIKIFITHTPNSQQICLHNPLFYHVIGGSDFQTKSFPETMLADNTGENISYKNKSYCELTTQYWAWKNMQADYYGFCHYRRYFSFAQRLLPEADCGFLVFEYADKNTQKQLCLEETSMRNRIMQYDFLIAKGIPVRPWARSVYDNYKKAVYLHREDLDLFLAIICKRYPQLRHAAKTYMNGKLFYPCNMFLMRRELFQEYSAMLFKLLHEFEQHVDMTLYSKEAYRTPGHLGERFLGIYYEYIKQKQSCHMGELQMAMIQKTQANTYTVPNHDEIPVVFAANQIYVPVLFTCLKSLCGCIDSSRHYHIYIFHTDIQKESIDCIQKGLANGNMQIEFVDVGAYVAGYCLKAKGQITAETYYRFLILDILKDCPKVVYLDTDIIIQRDIAQLYDVALGKCFLAAAADPDVIGQYNGANPDTKSYQDEVLRLKNPCSYIQAGVLVLNVKALNQITSTKKLLAMAEHGNYRYSDQDILNIVCQGRIKKLDMAWNVLMDTKHSRMEVIKYAPASILEEYESAREHPYIIHYCGSPKPWQDPEGDFAKEFWHIARKTPYYEILLQRMHRQEEKSTIITAKNMVYVIKKAAKTILPEGSRARKTVGKIYWKLK